MKTKYSRIPIGNLVEQVKKWNPQAEKDNQVITYLDISSVSRESKRVEESIEIKSYEAPSRARQLVAKDDVLVSTVRPNLNAVAYLEEEFDGATASTGFCVLRAKSNKLDSRYLYYWVRTTYFIDDMVRESTGASYPAVSDSIIKKNEIPLPPLEEQKRIAAILDKADRVRRKRQEAIRLTEELGRSIFLDMFGDPVTNPKGWEVGSIKDIAQVKTGKTPSRKESDNYGGSVPWVKTTEVKDCVIEDTEEHLTDKGASQMTLFPEQSILVAMYGQGTTRGKTALLSKPSTTNQACSVILPSKKYDTIYLWSLLQLSYKNLRELSRGGNQPNLNLDIIKNYQICIPPLKDQNHFAILEIKRRKQQDLVVYSLLESENLFNSLLQRAFRGEL